MSIAKFSKRKVHEEILREAKVLGLHAGVAEMIADKIDERLAEWTKKRSMITEKDLNAQIAKEIAKYNKDLAYIFKNKGKII